MVEVELCKQTFNDWFKLSWDLTFCKVLFPNLVVKRKQVLSQTILTPRHFTVLHQTSLAGRFSSSAAAVVSATDNAHWQALKLEIASQLGLEST